RTMPTPGCWPRASPPSRGWWSILRTPRPTSSSGAWPSPASPSPPSSPPSAGTACGSASWVRAGCGRSPTTASAGPTSKPPSEPCARCSPGPRSARCALAKDLPTYDGSEIAIVGMSCRFPGARNVAEYWENLRQGKESLSRITAEDLAAAGLAPALREAPRYVPAVPLLADIELFDAPFFGYTPLEARIMDPQQRLFLECAWEAFEQAGYDPETVAAAVGVFTGAKTNTYLFGIV